MDQFFTANYSGTPFIMFGWAHLGALAAILMVNIWLMHFKGANEQTRRRIRIGMAIILWVNEAFYHLWNIYYGLWKVQEHLPLHVCSVLIWLAGLMLIFKNYSIYEFAFFMGIGGAIHALLTPDIGMYGFPHFRFFSDLYFPQPIGHLGHLYDSSGGFSPDLEITTACYVGDESVHGSGFLFQPTDWQQLPVRRP